MPKQPPKKAAAAPRTQINDLAEADRALERIVIATAAVEEITAKTNAEINRLKQQAAALSASHQATIAEHDKALMSFLKKNKKLFVENRSLDLVYGRIGFRISKTIEVSTNTIEKLKKIEREDAIIVKESPNKNVLATWDDKDLKKVGAARVINDEPYYNPSKQEIAKRMAA